MVVAVVAGVTSTRTSGWMRKISGKIAIETTIEG
jgi:hypothetical protein